MERELFYDRYCEWESFRQSDSYGAGTGGMWLQLRRESCISCSKVTVNICTSIYIIHLLYCPGVEWWYPFATPLAHVALQAREYSNFGLEKGNTWLVRLHSHHNAFGLEELCYSWHVGPLKGTRYTVGRWKPIIAFMVTPLAEMVILYRMERNGKFWTWTQRLCNMNTMEEASTCMWPNHSTKTEWKQNGNFSMTAIVVWRAHKWPISLS